MSVMAHTVDQVRGFNRYYTRILGLLQPDLAGSAFGLTEARVLFELAHSRDRLPVAVTDLRRDLDLDAGYLSRILSTFTARGLVVREPSQTDGRRQVVRLTPDGDRAFNELDRLQSDAIEDLLAPLDEDLRAEVTAAMRRIRTALGDDLRPSGPDRPAVVLRAPRPGDLGWVIERHGTRYAAEYGWDASFEALVARIVADFAAAADPRTAAWIAELDGRRVGCVFCTASKDPADPAAPDTAQLRLLLVDPAARGAGVGSRLVDECLRFAERTGYRRITLWTNDVLVAARRIYERAGFHCDRREPHRSFGRDLVGEYWSRDL